MDRSNHIHDSVNENQGNDRLVNDYLQGRMDPAAEHALEKKAAEDPFLREALEGLENMPSENLPRVTKELESYLQNKIKSKKKSNRKTLLPSFIIFAVILLMLLLLASFLLLQRIL